MTDKTLSLVEIQALLHDEVSPEDAIKKAFALWGDKTDVLHRNIDSLKIKSIEKWTDSEITMVVSVKSSQVLTAREQQVHMLYSYVGRILKHLLDNQRSAGEHFDLIDLGQEGYHSMRDTFAWYGYLLKFIKKNREFLDEQWAYTARTSIFSWELARPSDMIHGRLFRYRLPYEFTQKIFGTKHFAAPPSYQWSDEEDSALRLFIAMNAHHIHT